MESLHTYWLVSSSKMEGFESMMLVIKTIYVRNFQGGMLSQNVVMVGSTCSQASRKVCSNYLGLLTEVEGADCSSSSSRV
jgi:hypothetical protein